MTYQKITLAKADGLATLTLNAPDKLNAVSRKMIAEIKAAWEDIGADAYVFCSADLGGEQTRLVARTEVRDAPKQGERVTLRPRAEEAHLFDPESGERLTDS